MYTGEALGMAASTLGPVAPRPSGSRLAPAMAAVEARWPRRHRVLWWPRQQQGSTRKGCAVEGLGLAVHRGEGPAPTR